MLALGFHERTDVTRSSAQLVFRRIEGTAERSLPPGISITQVYDNVGQGLLILGEPGTGKTTLLLDLAHNLLIRAENDTTHPIPVILNLSSWASKKLPLATWLIDQLQLVYSVSSRLSQTWLEQGRWLLLLDGLDEVEAGARAACIEAINLYRAEHFVPLVVCSRSHEYLVQNAQLALPDAVVVQLLQEQQVTEHLKRVGKQMAAVWAVLSNNAVLQQLITTPLMLSIVTLTYREKTVKDLPQLGSPEEQQQQIFKSYIDHVLEQRVTKCRFTPQQARHWLIWLAQQMKRHHLTEFYLEWLQPSWLMTRRAQITYQLFSRLATGLPVGLVTGLLVGLLVGLVTGLPGGLFFGLLAGLLAGFFFGMLGELSKKKFQEEIQPAEVLKWSQKRFWQWLFLGLVTGLLVGLLAWLFTGLLAWLLAGLLGGPLLGLPGGVSGGQASKNMRTRPNQGIRNSGWNALRFGLLVGLPSGLPVVLLTGLFGEGHLLEQWGGLVGGLLTGLIFGGLPLGGEAYLKHYVLRYLLIRSGAMPWHYVHFLEEATEHILLQRVGGGYRFIHPLFLDYFATLAYDK